MNNRTPLEERHCFNFLQFLFIFLIHNEELIKFGRFYYSSLENTCMWTKNKKKTIFCNIFKYFPTLLSNFLVNIIIISNNNNKSSKSQNRVQGQKSHLAKGSFGRGIYTKIPNSVRRQQYITISENTTKDRDNIVIF